MWFRRDLNDFSSNKWVLDGGFYRPVICVPEPWRAADYDFVVPVEFALIFADRHRMVSIERDEQEYIASLVDSISSNGLMEPPVMVYDHFGKLRYHDGYHRLIALSHVDSIKRIPVKLRESPRVRGYGRLVGEEIISIFEVFDGSKKEGKTWESESFS